MPSRGWILAAVWSVAFSSAFAAESTVDFEIEILPLKDASDAETAFKSAAPWFRKVLSDGAELEENEVIIRTTAPGKLLLTVPKSKAPSVGRILTLVAADPVLSFCRVHPDSRQRAARVAAGEDTVPGFRVLSLNGPDNDPILVALLPVMTGDSIKSASAHSGAGGNTIRLDFNARGEKIMGAWTAGNIGEQLAIVLGKKVMVAPVVREPFSTGCVISGGKLDPIEVFRLAVIIENPPPFSFTVRKTP